MPASAAQLLRDINATIGVQTFVPLNPVDLPTTTLFALNDGMHGMELWATDGTAAGTRLVKDINPGSEDSRIESLIAINGIAYFWANDGTNGLEIWRSDGSTAGTFIVANIIPDDRVVDGPIGFPLTVVGSNFYFVANDGQAGAELWRSDGTRIGTYLLRNIAAGSTGSEIHDMTVLGSTLFFVADDGVNGLELWSSDGTVAGTRMVRDINPGSAGSSPRYLVVAGSTLFFAADSAADGGELWRANDSGLSATKISDFGPGPASSYIRTLVRVGNGVVFLATPDLDHLYFAAGTGGIVDLGNIPFIGAEIVGPIVLADRALFQLKVPIIYRLPNNLTDVFTTDGTLAGTHQILPQEQLYFASQDTNCTLTDSDHAYCFAVANVPDGQINVWVSDGTTAGTRQVTDLAFGVGFQDIAHLGNQIFFTYGVSRHPAGQELWSTDGSQAGTQLLADIRPGPDSSSPLQFRIARGKLLFTANDGSSGIEPWVSDGTAAGTVPLGNLRVDSGVGDSNPYGMLTFGAGMLFTADDGVSGRELWATDGTVAGTRLVADIAPGAGSSNPSWFIDMGGFALFEADDGVSGRELWRTDGTTAGTLQVADIAIGAAHSDPIGSSFGGFVLNGIAYFGVGGRELWTSDGTAAGTRLFMDLSPPGTNGVPVMIGVLGSHGLFAANAGATPRLWSTDGTIGGTGTVRDDVAFNGIDFAFFDGHVYFAGEDTGGDRELWRSDGTPAGTQLVADLSPTTSSSPWSFRATDDLLAFNACVAAACEMYVMNGSAPGINRISGLATTGESTVDGSRLIFRATPSQQLMVTDGTVSGTVPLLPATLPFSGPIGQFVWFAGSLLMTVNDDSVGPSIWRSDGTQAGTGFVADHGGGGYFPVGSRLFYAANQPSTGTELWMLETSQPNANDDSAQTAVNVTVRVAALANDTVLRDTLDAGSLEIITPPSLGAATIDSVTHEFVYTPNPDQTGSDFLRYQVRNSQGVASNAAFVTIVITASPGPGPGDPPSPPPPPPGGGGNGGGGGGSTDLTFLILLLLQLCLPTAIRSASRRFTAS
jgi:ELWxxDGT repeat protein